MANEKRTKVVLEAEARGFGAAERSAERMKNALDTGKATKALKQTEQAVSDVTKKVDSLGKTLGKVNFSKSFTDAASAIAKAESQLDDFDRALAAVEAKQAEREKRAQTRRSLGKGIVQGLGIGEYFPDNENMRANVAGRLAGGAARRIGAGGASIAGSAWTGSQGVLSGLAGIPIVGGALSGGLQSALGMSQEYLALAQTQQEMGVFSRVGGSSLRGQRIGTRKGVDATAQPADSRKLLDSSFGEPISAGEARMQQRADEQAIAEGRPWDTSAQKRMRKLRDEDFDRRTSGPQSASGPSKPIAPEGIFTDPLAHMAKSGLDFGLNRMEALRFSSSLAQSSGGSVQDVNDSTFRTALAAKTRFGIDEGVSGSFMRGARTGGGGGGMEGFEAAIGRGLALGLEGSDLQRYMQTTAQVLDEFETSGMPLDAESFGRAQAQLSGALGAGRGTSVASGLLSAGRGLSTMGAQSATQFQMLQDLYGYKGGGTDEYFDAIQRSEKGDIGDVGGFFNKLTQGGTSTKSKALILKSRLQNDLGISLGTDEAARIAGGDMGAFEGRLREAAQRTAGFDMQASAQGTISGAVRRQKGQENTRMGVGGKLISAAQDFEDASINAAKSMSNFDESLKTFSTMARQASIDIEKLFEILGAFVNKQVAGGKG